MTSEQNGGRKRGRPREGEAPDPQMIERIAFRSFAIAGYEATSLRDVALTSNVDPALISRRYGSKMGLWRATVDSVAARLDEIYRVMHEEMEGGGAFVDRFRAALRHFVVFNCTMPELTCFFINELRRPGERMDYVSSKIWQPYLMVMQTLFSEASEKGASRLPDPLMAPVSFLGLAVMPQLVAPALNHVSWPEGPSPADRIMTSIDAILVRAEGHA
ncbi:MAG TPA: TetR/AcrR family transcriptional regulator [Sphingobium sp.]|nr:TetR/AcrR family transcriptional regulator [Sphingobium sp.]